MDDQDWTPVLIDDSLAGGTEDKEPCDHERDQQVDRRACSHDHDPFPRRLVAVSARHYLRRQSLFGAHPADLRVPPERDHADPVLGLPPGEFEQHRPEEQGEPLHPHPDRFGGEQVAELVQQDEQGDSEKGEQEGQGCSQSKTVAT